MRERSATPRRPLGHRPGALVVGGNPMALGIVRSLGRRGIPVWVLADDHLVAATSRYASRSIPWPTTERDRQLAFLLELSDRYGLEDWVLFPTGDEDAALMAHHAGRLSRRFRLTTSKWEVMRWAHDKRLTYRLAETIGVDHPWTRYPRDREELVQLECPFPVILKPAMKASLNPFTRAKAWRVESRDDLLARYDEACSMVPPDTIMVQELIPGGGELQFSCAGLWSDGRPLASLVAKRARQYPVDFGRASSYVETVHLPEVEAPAQRLLAAMGFTGLAEVEFKQDRHTGQYKLLDVNPRVWGWHTLCQRAGVDFPYLAWLLARGEPTPEVRAQAGVRWVRMSTDLLAAAREIRRGHLSVAEYLRSLRGPPEFALFALDDPLPALLELPLQGLVVWRRRTA